MEASEGKGLVRRLAGMGARLVSGQADEVFDDVVRGAVDDVGFRAAALLRGQPEGDLRVLSVAGPEVVCAGLRERAWPSAAVVGLLGSGRPQAGRPSDAGPARLVSLGTSLLPGSGLSLCEVVVVPVHRGGDRAGLLIADSEGRLPLPVDDLEALEALATFAGAALEQVDLLARMADEHARLQASEEAFRFAFDGSAGAMATVSLAPDRLGRFLQANQAFQEVVGSDRARLKRLTWFDLVAPEERDDSRRAVAGFASGAHQTVRGERQVLRLDGSRRWADLTWTRISTGDGSDPFLLIHLDDVTDRRREQERLRRAADEDPLTGVANRRALLRALNGALAARRSGGPPGVIIYADINSFKRINDTFGHAIGDQVLRTVSRRLRSAVRETDMVARLGGDEFVVIGYGLSVDGGHHLADRIGATLVSSLEQPVEVSLGVATFDDASDAEALLDRADLDMYARKQRRD